MRTYYIENINAEILGYYKTLNEAKYSLNRFITEGYSNTDIRIVMLQGQYFGEGFHKYYLTKVNNNKYKREVL